MYPHNWTELQSAQLELKYYYYLLHATMYQYLTAFSIGNLNQYQHNINSSVIMLDVSQRLAPPKSRLTTKSCAAFNNKRLAISTLADGMQFQNFSRVKLLYCTSTDEVMITNWISWTN